MLRIALFITALVHISIQSCVYINKQAVYYLDNRENTTVENVTVLSDCISDESLGTNKATNVSVYCGTYAVPKLEKNVVSNMESLLDLYFGQCTIQIIEPGAFSNLPKLLNLKIFGNPLKVIPSGVFNLVPNVQKIAIFDNKVSQIEDHAFANLPNLEEINLERNELDHLKREWFTNTSNIEGFYVPNNLIRKIPAGLLHGWKKVKVINLRSNLISIIEGPLFKDNPPFIQYLGLHNNRLESLSPNTFTESEIFINYISLSANLLNFIPEEFLSRISMVYLDLFSNPLKCPCLDKINKILKNKGVKASHDKLVLACQNRAVPACGYARNESDVCTETVDRELTQRMLSDMKEVGYDSIMFENLHPCAAFGALE